MTQAIFMQKLRRCLHWYYSPQESGEILTDYREFFEEGCAEGKSEEDLCRQFGSPGRIVRELAAGKKSVFFAIRLILAGLFILLYGNLNLLLSDKIMPPTLHLPIHTAIILLLPFLLWGLLGDNPAWCPARPDRSRQSARHVLRAACILIGAGDLFIYGGICYLLFQSTRPLGLVPRELEILSVATVTIYGFILLIALFACLYYFMRTLCQTFPCICLLIGTLYTLNEMNLLIHTLDNPNRLMPALACALIPTLAGIFMALLFRLLIHRSSRKEGA